MIGEIISHYKILAKIGEGARGVVYKAEDLTLGRFVALKFFLTEAGGDFENKKRFIHEAKAASALDHANICSVHEVEETADGQMFICMAYYEGETIKDKIKRGPLRISEVIDYSIQVARGMKKAHEKGIVHRDIKPQNLLVTTEGLAKILDFGLAKLTAEKGLTREGITVGTVGYMSPEQARGETVDHRTDIWSLGVVMYEMITAQLPFKGEDAQAMIYSILNQEPGPMTGMREKLPVMLENIVDKCLSKDTSKRYQHFDELIVDLRKLVGMMDSSSISLKKPVWEKFPRRINVTFFLVVIAFLVVITVGLYLILNRGKPSAVSGELSSILADMPSIAVLPFKDISPEQKQEYFCDGMVEELIMALSRLKGLRVAARTSSFQFKGKDIDIREIGNQLNVQNVLEGSVRKVGKKMRITAQLINTANGYHLWGEAYEREFELDDVFEIQDEIARKIVDYMKVELVSDSKHSLIKRYTTDAKAYEWYLKGRYFWKKRLPDDIYKGIQFFNKAIKKDPNYALAYVGIADSYHLLSAYSILPPREAFSESKRAALKALEIDSNLGEAYNSLAAVNLFYEWDFNAAEEVFKKAIELCPRYVTAREWHAKCLAVTGHIEDSIKEMRLAVELEPLSISSQNGVARHLYFNKEYDAAAIQFKKVLELEPNCFYALAHLGQTYIKLNKYEEALDCFLKASIITKRMDPASLSGLAYTYGISGQREKALKILAELELMARQRYVRPIYIAGIYIGLGDFDNAFLWLEKAFNERCDWMIYLHIEHMLDPLRKDPRFAELIKRVGLKE